VRADGGPETLGLLLSAGGPLARTPPPDVQRADWLEGRQRLATVADSLALALANRLRDRLREQSIDPLTGLFNRRYLEETLERELHRASREARPVGKIMVDIDRFKSFNDTLGHDAGDHVLREVSHLLRASTRGEDIVCRLGGEEFTLLLPGAGLAATHERASGCVAVEALATNYRGQPLRRRSRPAWPSAPSMAPPARRC
jgi:diguanylate cyclase (GGDEF)-like protein